MSKHGEKNQRQVEREPELRIHTRGLRLELDRLPRFPKPRRWIFGVLVGVGIAVKIAIDLHIVS